MGIVLYGTKSMKSRQGRHRIKKTGIVLYGTKSNLGKYGYSRDHRPDKLQITVGISELANPINIPIHWSSVKELSCPKAIDFVPEAYLKFWSIYMKSIPRSSIQ